MDDTWVWVESPGTALDEEPRVDAVKFGGGYEQRAPSGLNTILQQWSLQFNDVDLAIAAEMMAFLREHKGVASFSYTPLWASSPIRVVCRKWRRSHLAFDRSSISATFEQVPEP